MKYGTLEVPFLFPDTAVELAHTEPGPSVDPERFKRDLHSWLYGINKKVESVGVAVSDKTRLCEFPIYLPLIAQAFMEHGLKKENITFYIAYGTHPRQSEEECMAAYGDSYREFNFVHHDARDESALVNLGTTSRGTEAKVRGDILEKDALVTFGAILHHYFAGFGGGRKLFFPGLAGYDSILHNHSLFLDFKNGRLDPGCQSGQLEDNPLAEDLEEIYHMLPPHLEIHGILNSRKEVCEIHFGLDYGQFRKATEYYDAYFRVSDAGDFDLVVASAGGYPKDINFIQGHKSIHNAASFVRDGGTLLILAQCVDGIGNKAFLELFKLGGPRGIFSEMEKQYKNNAGTALATLQKAKRVNIRFVTDLDKETCELMGCVKTSVEEAVALASEARGKVAVIENTSLLYR